jgi:hypothetical protein
MSEREMLTHNHWVPAMYFITNIDLFITIYSTYENDLEEVGKSGDFQSEHVFDLTSEDMDCCPRGETAD